MQQQSFTRIEYRSCRRLCYWGLFVLLAALLAACGQSTPEPVLSTPVMDRVVATDAVLPTASPPVEVQPSPRPETPTALPESESSAPGISMPLMGVETHRPGDDTILSLLSDSGARIVRYNGVLWSDVEPQEGQYNWAALQPLDNAFQELAARGIDVILIVRSAPPWAQKVPGSACGPVSQEKLGAFADFMAELVRRYSVPPYNVKYWELGNEPDVDVNMMPGDSVFGCWGDAADPFYGGGYYAEMLKAVYPAIKAADPDAQVLIGGLLLDCDPENPPEGKTCKPTRFFDGILEAGGADYFDIVSFHGYPPYVQQSLNLDREYPNWAARGGVVVGKINYLRDTMQLYGVEKPLFLTEGSLLCPEWNQGECVPPDDRFFEVQADYVVRLFVRNWAMDIRSTIWYQFEGSGWRYCGMVGEDADNPNPAFRAFRFLNQKLDGMNYVGDAPLPEEVAGYIFEGDGRQIWVIWSVDETPQMVDVPPGVLGVVDKYGQEIPASETQLTVSSPVYVEVVP